MIVKARIVKLTKDNELNSKIGSVRYLFTSAREQIVKLVKEMYQINQLLKMHKALVGHEYNITYIYRSISKVTNRQLIVHTLIVRWAGPGLGQRAAMQRKLASLTSSS